MTVNTFCISKCGRLRTLEIKTSRPKVAGKDTSHQNGVAVP